MKEQPSGLGLDAVSAMAESQDSGAEKPSSSNVQKSSKADTGEQDEAARRASVAGVASLRRTEPTEINAQRTADSGQRMMNNGLGKYKRFQRRKRRELEWLTRKFAKSEQEHIKSRRQRVRWWWWW
ncbi:hypothetical protein E4U43_006106 [Claviceps pusilla]|uniref:Uncharacterized protein n=1 Tax=Claviceps pusilla TaxID=123648 RepID=A0A9P7NE80_9HYPO|nr:hypothetical protein E4U43_006106 [Claviceps pusilla]